MKKINQQYQYNIQKSDVKKSSRILLISAATATATCTGLGLTTSTTH